jgi:hypothetical protein
VNAETIAQSAWDVNAELGSWHPQLTEVRANGRVGDCWMSNEWPGDDPAVLLGDYVTRPDCTWLLLVSECTISRPTGDWAPGHMVVVLERDSQHAVVLAGDDQASRCDTLGGTLIDHMRDCFGEKVTR